MKQYVISLDVDSVGKYRDLEKSRTISYELTDFSSALVLDNKPWVQELVGRYLAKGLPEGSIMMGAFHDLSIFSRDSMIRQVSLGRMGQCLRIAERLSLEMVLFYVNAPSYLVDVPDFDELLERTCNELRPLIQRFPSIRICFENRAEAGPALFLELLERLSDCKNIGFCLNYCRAALSAVSPEKWARTLAPYLCCLRIFDSNLQEPVSGQDDDLEHRFNRYRPFYEKFFHNSKVLFGYHDLHDSYVFEEEMEQIELVDEEETSTAMAEFYESSPEGMLEKIFFYMNQLVGEKGFSSTILLLTDMGRTLASSERASFWYWDRQRKQYWTIVALGRDRIVIEEGSGLVGASIQNNEVLIINDPYADKRFCVHIDIESGFVSRSILCIPVTDSKGKVIGAFQAVNKLREEGYGKFDEQDVKRLAMAAAYCGRTLEAYLLYQETLVDVLTGLKNRRGFWEYYEEHVEPALERQPASLIMCDVDFFKLVNDTYGHAVGDEVLVSVGGILKEQVGELGEVARWGGEEFLIVLKDHDLAKAVQFAESLRLLVEESPSISESQRLKVTMSFGVTVIDSLLTVEKNVDAADKKLYQAKENGRNQVGC